MLTIRRCLNACIQKAVKESFGDDGEDEGEKEKLSVSIVALWLVLVTFVRGAWFQI